MKLLTKHEDRAARKSRGAVLCRRSGQTADQKSAAAADRRVIAGQTAGAAIVETALQSLAALLDQRAAGGVAARAGNAATIGRQFTTAVPAT